MTAPPTLVQQHVCNALLASSNGFDRLYHCIVAVRRNLAAAASELDIEIPVNEDPLQKLFTASDELKQLEFAARRADQAIVSALRSNY